MKSSNVLIYRFELHWTLYVAIEPIATHCRALATCKQWSFHRSFNIFIRIWWIIDGFFSRLTFAGIYPQYIIMDTSQYEQNVPFPPANFDSWPITRIGALTIDALLLIVVLLLWFIPRRVYNLNTVPDDEDEPAYVSMKSVNRLK